MTDRDRLIELIVQANEICSNKDCAECEYLNNDRILCDTYNIADYLLANGVIVQKQGQWISAPIKEKGYDSKTIPTCTNCGYQSFITYTYCPECGAKLKEREGKCI